MLVASTKYSSAITATHQNTSSAVAKPTIAIATNKPKGTIFVNLV